MKVLRAGPFAGNGLLARFMEEARSAAQLQNKGIVRILDAGEFEGFPYIVSDFIAGVTLAESLEVRRPSFREAARLAAEVADALEYAHQKGVIHRDVKAQNIMLDTDGQPHLMDFGLAKREASDIVITVEGQILGTPAYMPPEQARGELSKVNRRSDVYSLGVVLYQMITGELPFRGTTRMLLHQVLHDDPRPPRKLNDRIPRDLETICLTAMAKEPHRRYATAALLSQDLRAFLDGREIQARPAQLSRARLAMVPAQSGAGPRTRRDGGLADGCLGALGTNCRQSQSHADPVETEPGTRQFRAWPRRLRAGRGGLRLALAIPEPAHRRRRR